MKKTMGIVLLMIFLSGCTQNNDVEGYLYRVNGLDIAMGQPAEDFLSKTGNPTDQYSAPSCAFDGDDTVYDFGSYQITTYMSNG